ncbi:MAG: class I SAM-dependent methyltransferase [Thiolinea sp.]
MSADHSQLVREFNNQQEIYHHAITENYMAHREIHTAIHQHLNSVYDKPFSLLDLGCGDAAFTSRSLQSTLIKRYTGIDQSAHSLQNARKNLDAAGIKAQLIQGNHTDFTSLIDDKKFRVMIVGFSLYLLPSEEKIRFFRECRKHLRKRGRVLVYDVMRRHNEVREDYLQRYYQHAAENWPTLNAHALEQLAQYINLSDHPESLESLMDIARRSGFKHAELVYVDSTGFHQLIEFVQ